MNAAEHLEQHLGRIEQGWSSGLFPGVQVCLFRDQPVSGVITLATLGLSNNVLGMSGGRQVRQELLLAIRTDGRPKEFAKILLHVAEELCTDGRALLRGETIPLEHDIGQGSGAKALYASIPVVFPDALATLNDTSPRSVFVWLFPILPAEDVMIRTSGWSEFEDRLEACEPDLFDIYRNSVV